MGKPVVIASMTASPCTSAASGPNVNVGQAVPASQVLLGHEAGKDQRALQSEPLSQLPKLRLVFAPAHHGHGEIAALLQKGLPDNKMVLYVPDVRLKTARDSLHLAVDPGPRGDAEFGMEGPGGEGLDAVNGDAGVGGFVPHFIPEGRVGSNHLDVVTALRQTLYQAVSRHRGAVQLRWVGLVGYQYLQRSYPTNTSG